MPIPTSGAWPPPAHQPAYQAYADWDAWYDGRPEVLASAYLGRAANGRTLPPSQRTWPGQYAGGIIGTLSRWLWGAPPRTDQRDTRLHVPTPADLAATCASLLFSEPPKITADGNAAATAAIEQLIEHGLHMMLRHAAELGSVLGDVYLRPVLDSEIAPGRAIPTATPADAAIPVIRWGQLAEVTFWSVLEESSGTVVRLLEHHDVVGGAGRIIYALHEGTATELGRAIPLTEHDATVDLIELLDETGAQPTGLDRLDVVRVPNAGPQRIWRRLPALKYHGRSDMDGNEHLFDKIDEVWTSWMRDIRLARGRITVPDYMLRSNGPGQGATWDPDQEVYSAINAAPDQGQQLTYTQFEIRHQEHKATIDELMQVALRHAGLSAQTMGEAGSVAMTATEAQSRERQTFVSRGDRITTWAPALARYVELHLAVERVKLGAQAEPVLPNIEFGDSVTESPETVARTAQLLSAAKAASVRTLVQMVHPDWDKDQVDEEVAAIQADEPPTVDVGGSLGALAGNQPAGDAPADQGPPAGE